MVNNGSDFYGGQHKFRDENCRIIEKEYVKIGNSWNMSGIHTSHNTIVILYNNESRLIMKIIMKKMNRRI